MNAFFHYTCSDAFESIRADAILRPNPHPLLAEAGALVWLTDLDQPDKYALGLTSFSLLCDRTEYRAVVETEAAVRWPVFARRMPREVRWELEGVPGVLPMHWWVVAGATVPVLSIAPVSVPAGRVS